MCLDNQDAAFRAVFFVCIIVVSLLFTVLKNITGTVDAVMRFVAARCMRQKSINDDYARMGATACAPLNVMSASVFVFFLSLAHLFGVRMSLSHRWLVYYTHMWSNVLGISFRMPNRNRVTGVRTMQTCDPHNNI